MSTKFQDWLIQNQPSKNMTYEEAFWHDNMFLRDKLLPLLYWHKDYAEVGNYKDFEQMIDAHCEIIGTHRSKSIVMPVLRINYKGCIIVLRYNFYNYEIAVMSLCDLYIPMKDLFYSDGIDFFYEGFPKEYQLEERYESNHKKFMANIGDNYQCYTFFFLLKNQIDSVYN